MIRALEFTAQNINSTIVDRIRKKIEETGDTEIDFGGTEILELVHKDIAELMISHGVSVYNISKLSDRDTIEYHRQLLMKPQVDDIEQYIEVFKTRFPVGTVCILDRTVMKGLAINENRESIIMIDAIFHNRIRIRKYHHSKVQPIYFRMAGGHDSPSLYSIEEVFFDELYNNEIVIDHPRNQKERDILDILFSI